MPKFIKNISGYILPMVFPIGLILVAGCSRETITEQNFNAEDIAPFVEPGFPFITTSVDARRLGPGFPDDNITPRCLALRLGEEAFACFDTDMLRWSVAWTGEFLPMVTMAQISYRDFHNKENQIPVIAGEPKIATGLYPGWAGPEPRFIDPRPPSPNPGSPPWGPIPQEMGRWNGVYLEGSEVVMAYTAGNTDIYEKPGSVSIEGETGFTRTFQIGGPRETLSLVAAELRDGVRSEVTGTTAFIYSGGNEGLVTAVGLAGGGPGVEVKTTDNRYATVHLSPGSEDLTFTLVMWRGPADRKELFERMLSGAKTGMPDFPDGGPAHWTETVMTRGQLAPDTAAYVIDRLTLPVPNPWNRNVRVVDVAFFDGKRAALVTFEGDVWIVEDIDRGLRGLTWRRYASGLYEPQSIEVVRDTIYVYGKEGIVRFHDLNDDGAADYYENFSNLMAQSIETREWASDMVTAPDGGFYVAKFGALDMGPETSSPKSIMGFRAGSQHDGSILKISADGRSIKHYATGFRGPYLGIHPETGVLSASDQQGNYMPSTPILLVNEGDYYGVPATVHRDPVPGITPPLLWIPHNVDRSGTGQVWITSDRMGPLSGGLVHLSYGRPGLFKVLIDSTGNAVQGGVSVIAGNYPAPVMKGAINPRDGQLYVTGFSLWGSNSSAISAFIRLRYTGLPGLLPEKFQARDGGVMIRFGVELDEETATNPANYQVKRWNYQRSEQYGSGHYKLDGTPGEELLPVFSAHLSDDKHAVFIVVPNIGKVMQMQVSYDLKSAGGPAMNDDLWFTVNHVEEPDLLAEGFSDSDMEELVFDDKTGMEAGDPGEPVSVEHGKQLFLRGGCMACHSVGGNNGGMIGPPLKGLFGSEQHFEDGSTAVADEEYLRQAVIQPGEKIVEGYAPEMPSFLGILSDNEIESIILYIKSLPDDETP